MNIVTDASKRKKGRLLDGIDTLLELSEDDFNEVVRQFKINPNTKYQEGIKFYYTDDSCEVPGNQKQIGLERTINAERRFIGRGYFLSKGQPIKLSQILEELHTILINSNDNSIKCRRIKELLSLRDLDALKENFAYKEHISISMMDKTFEILGNDELLSKFLDFDNNKYEFEIDGKNIELSEYLKVIGKIFAQVPWSEKQDVLEDFYIPEIDEYKKGILKIADNYNLTRYIDPRYSFKISPFSPADDIIRKDDEADWKINSELKTAVLNGMDENYTLEEKAIYIYCALCKELRYNEGYFYRDITGEEEYSPELSVEHMENIKPGSEITCYDLTREFCKFVNEIDGDIEAVIISEGSNQGHFKMGFYTDKVSAVLDGIRTINGTNDLSQIKNGLKLIGIEKIFDKNDILDKAVEKVYPQFLEKEPITTKEYIEQLKMLPEQESIDNLGLKLEAFAEMMETQGIIGNEAVQTFVIFNRAGFFGTEIEKSLVAKRIDDNGKEKFKRKIVIMQKNDDLEKSVYMLDTESLEVTECSSQELDQKIKSGEFIYEDEEYKLDGIGVEK